METRSKIHMRGLWLATCAFMFSTMGCELISAIDRSKIDETSSGATAGTAGTAGTSATAGTAGTVAGTAGTGGTAGTMTSGGTAGSGGKPECVEAKDCQDFGKECLIVDCDQGK